MVVQEACMAGSGAGVVAVVAGVEGAVFGADCC